MNRRTFLSLACLLPLYLRPPLSGVVADKEFVPPVCVIRMEPIEELREGRPVTVQVSRRHWTPGRYVLVIRRPDGSVVKQGVSQREFNSTAAGQRYERVYP